MKTKRQYKVPVLEDVRAYLEYGDPLDQLLEQAVLECDDRLGHYNLEATPEEHARIREIIQREGLE
jgi:hypothetical protein